MLERACNLAQRLEGDAGGAPSYLALVPEQHLDHANVGLLPEEVRGEAVPQCMQVDGLVDLGHPRRGVAGPVELTRRQWVYRVLPRKQPRCARCSRRRSRACSSRTCWGSSRSCRTISSRLLRSTLAEALEASLLLFVVDASYPTYELQL